MQNGALWGKIVPCFDSKQSAIVDTISVVFCESSIGQQQLDGAWCMTVTKMLNVGSNSILRPHFKRWGELTP